MTLPARGPVRVSSRRIEAVPDLDAGPDVGPFVGTVSWYCEHRGFGFVETGAGEPVFMSFRDLPGPGFRRVRAGQQVSFTLDHDVHGPVARGVCLLEARRAA